MNNKTILKRALPLVIVLAVIIIVAVSCTIISHDKATPAITNSSETYLSTEENGITYTVENGKIYDSLKSTYGSTILLNRIDTELLKKTTIKVDGEEKTAWDSVSADEVKEAIDEAASATDLEGDEYDEAIADYEETMFSSYGYTTMDEIKAYHQMVLAKKAYAKYQLELAIEAADAAAAEDSSKEPYFTEDDYQDQYDSTYLTAYYVLIVPFTSVTEANNALAQENVKISSDKGTVDGKEVALSNVWVWLADEGEHKANTPLTKDEIIATFIDLYNTRYAYKNSEYPTATEVLTAGTNYTVTDGAYSFINKAEDSDPLYYTDSALSSFNSTARSYVKNTMTSLNADSVAYSTTTSDETTTLSTSAIKWYTPSIKSYESGSLQVLMLKLGEVAPEALWTDAAETTYNPTVKAAIYEDLVEAELTTTYIATKMAELRADQDLIIYDETLESSYISSISSYDVDYSATKKSSKTLIATVKAGADTFEYSADDFFKDLDKAHGIAAAISEVDFIRTLSSADNKVFDYQKYLSGAKEKACVLDSKKWTSYKEEVVTEKENFAAGSYSSYGYDASYGWKNFMHDVYGVDGELEMAIYFLYSDLQSDAMAENARLIESEEGAGDELNVNSDLWKTYNDLMQDIVDAQFTVTGYHFLISVNDADGDTTDPSTWTSYQVECAKELYNQVIAYLQSYSGDYATAMENIVTAFEASPRFVARLAQETAAQPALENGSYVYPTEGLVQIQLAKYKSAGLSVKYEDLDSFSNGTMVAEFDAAVKEIYDAAIESGDLDETVIYGANKATDADGHYLVTEYGYHVYVNTACNAVTEWSYTDTDGNTQKGVLPTMQMVKTYLTNSSASYLYEVDSEGNLVLDDDGDPVETTIKFSSDMSTAVTTYYTPIADELGGSTYNSVVLYRQIKALTYNFTQNNYTIETFNKYVDMKIKSALESLSYTAELLGE